jgi:excisionase family DNA binding protein
MTAPVKRRPGRQPPPRPDPVDPTPDAPPPVRAGGEGLADLKAAAAFLGGVHVDTVRNLIAKGKLRGVKIGRRTMVPWASVRLLAEQGTG